MLIIVCGLPGSGKTYFASAFAQAVKGVHVNTDKVRKDTSGDPDYSVKGRMEVYHKMLHWMEPYLASDTIIVADGTFSKRSIREKFEETAARYKHKTYYIKIKASEDEIRKRTGHKRAFSDADYEVYLHLKEEFEPLLHKHLELISDEMNIEHMIEKARAYILVS